MVIFFVFFGIVVFCFFFFFSSRRRHTRLTCDWSSDVCSSDLAHSILFTALIAYENLLIGLDMMRRGETAVSTKYKLPKDFRVGAGFWEIGRASCRERV